MTDLTPPAEGPPRGPKGWMARRAEAMLRKPRRARPALTEPGEYQVVLQLTGASPVRVVTVISEATGLDFISASALAQDAPAVVVSGISQDSADRVVDAIAVEPGHFDRQFLIKVPPVP